MSDWRDEREAEFDRSREERIRRREEKLARERQRQRMVRLVAAGVVCGIVLIVLISLLKPHGGGTSAGNGTGASATQTQTQSENGSGQQTNSFTPDSHATDEDDLSDEAKARIAEVSERASANCTGAQPSDLTDPDTYNERGRHIMRWIADTYADDPDFDNAGSLSYATHYASDGSVAPYLLAVNRAQNTVTVYVLDSDGNYTVPYQAFVCSTGDATPIGYYTIPGRSSWGYLYGDVYGQYVTRITGDILFHSVPYYSQHQDDLEYQQYNKLGTSASLGCVRLQVCDTKWIYDNCPAGTPVIIYDDKVPGPLGKPGTIRVDEKDDDVRSKTYRGFDPTDPNAENPWDEQYRSGTAIRTDVAQREWEQAQDRGTWSATINATDLQGHSTDASTAGNPG